MFKKAKFNLNHHFLLIFILIVSNIILSTFLDLQTLRLVRITSTLILFLWFFKIKLNRKFLSTIAFSMLLIADLALLNYENKWFCFVRFITFIIINILLATHIFSKKSFRRFKIVPFVMICVLFVSCIFLIRYLAVFIDFSIFGKFHEFLYYIYALSTLFLVMFTVFHSINDYSKKIDIFFAAVVAFLLSDLLLIIGYYENWYIAIQIERIFHLLAIGLIVYYVVLYNAKEDGELENII